MSEHWPGIGSEQRNVESEAIDSSSANGAYSDEPAGESLKPAVADYGGVADDGASTDEGSVFLAELVRAMQTTAGVERVRIDEDTERRRQAHIDQVRAREASEADRMRELAGEDMKAIEAWATGETKRIQAERKRRATELNEKLETNLAEHRSKVDREVEGVESAIATYRADVEAFFAALESESDLVLIAQQAAKRPTFPALDAAARSDALEEAELSFAQAPPPVFDEAATDAGTAGADEPAVVGVMDHQALAEAFESWSAGSATSPEPEAAGAPDDTEQDGETREPADSVTATNAPTQGRPGSLFQSLPVPRPMSFLRRDPNSGDHSKDES
jgi:hypothetical protein